MIKSAWQLILKKLKTRKSKKQKNTCGVLLSGGYPAHAGVEKICFPFCSCVLKVSMVECQSIPLNDTLDRHYSIDTLLTHQSPLDHHSIDTSVDTWSTSHLCLGRESTKFLIDSYRLVDTGQLSTDCQSSVDRVLTKLLIELLIGYGYLYM